MLKKELIDDIILRVTKGAPSDDLELEPRQVAFWFDLVAGELVPGFLNTRLRNGSEIDNIFIKVEDDLVPIQEDVVMLEDGDDRVYIELDEVPMNLIRDRGLVRVITEEGLVVNKIGIAGLDTLNAMTFAKPNRENLIHTRIDNKIYIHGLSPKNVRLTKFSVWYIPQVNISDLDDDDEVKITDELINLISDEVEKKAWRQLNGVADNFNDAEDDVIAK